MRGSRRNARRFGSASFFLRVRLDSIASLVAKSLLRQERAEGEPRYRMLETVREFAAKRLAEAGEEVVIRERHAAWCLVKRSGLGRQRGPRRRQMRWMSSKRSSIICERPWTGT